jgi:hypothetical protein
MTSESEGLGGVRSREDVRQKTYKEHFVWTGPLAAYAIHVSLVVRKAALS